LDRTFVMNQIQALIDTLYLDDYMISAIKLTVSKKRESMVTELKTPQPSQAASDERFARALAEDNPY
jgi:hypothetical protein